MLRRIAQRQEEFRMDGDRLLRRRIRQGRRSVEIQVAHLSYGPWPIAFMRQHVMIEPARAALSESLSLTWRGRHEQRECRVRAPSVSFRTTQAPLRGGKNHGEEYRTNGSRAGRS